MGEQRIRLASAAEATCVFFPPTAAAITVKCLICTLPTSHAVECRGEFAGPVELDLGNLTVYEPRGPSAADLAADATAACLAHGRNVVQKLVVSTACII